MDGTTPEHSDSDSGESWTLLENNSACSDDASGLSECPIKRKGEAVENNEKDDDTDGISIISDSDPESITPCENYEKCLLSEENRPTEPQMTQFVSVTPFSPNIIDDHHESIRSEDPFLGDNTGKLKTYVHRRNKRLSTVLNIIVLGSVITAAGVAIGHMWGARDDCSMHTVPSVNKILSNLYKLQEENSHLRNKIKELTLMNNVQMQQRKPDSEKLSFKQHRCKKVFEESLNNKNVDKLIKCVESEKTNVRNYMIESEYEKDFLNDVNKLKNVYEQNKSLLDEEIAERLKIEEQSVDKIKNKFPKSNKVKTETNYFKDINLKKRTDIDKQVNKETIENDTEALQKPNCLFSFKSDSSRYSEKESLHLKSASFSEEDRKIKQSEKQFDILAHEYNVEPDLSEHRKEKPSYADSLKLDKGVNKKNDNKQNQVPENKIKEYIRKKKLKKDYDTISENSVSEEELRKDNRYSGPKHKQERKKRDRQKLHKKQKRKNKYEQWEMKGGYMKDYDDISVSSSQENDYSTVTEVIKKNNDINTETDETVKSKSKIKADIYSKHDKNNGKNNNKKEKDLNWYEKRAALRKEARQKLEQELFGDSTNSNNAGWYFRRMQRREQCRTKGDNSTYRKLSKRNMNFKMKH